MTCLAPSQQWYRLAAGNPAAWGVLTEAPISPPATSPSPRKEATSPTQVSPCAACKFLRRKCSADCLFSPYFPPDQPQKFANVHKVFGASNITKLLHDLPIQQREDAVNSLAYEADARVKDPVYGCVGAISILQQQVAHLQLELALAHAELQRLQVQSSPVRSPVDTPEAKGYLDLGSQIGASLSTSGGPFDPALLVADPLHSL